MRMSGALVTVILAAGCAGGGDRAGEDAHSLDAAVDAIDAIDAAVDLTPGFAAITVDVHEFGGGAPSPGAQVWFLAPDGDLDSQAITDSGGHVDGLVPDGGSVLVVDPNWTPDNLDPWTFSVLAPEDGDHLLIGSPTPDSVAVVAGGTIELPPGPAGTQRYQVVGRCAWGSGETTTLPISLYGCAPGPVDLLASVDVFDDHLARYYLPIPAAQLSAGTTLHPAGPWQGAVPFTLTYGNLPMERLLVRTQAIAGTIWLDGGALTVEHPGQAVSGTVDHPPPWGDATLVTTIVSSWEGAARWLVSRQAGYTTDYSVPDLAGELLPSVTATGASTIDVSWALGDGQPYDGALVRFAGDSWNAAQQTFGHLNWLVVVPPGTTHVTLPAALVPGWGPFVRMEIDIELIDDPDLTPGRAFREHGVQQWGTSAPTRPGVRRESSAVTRFLVN